MKGVFSKFFVICVAVCALMLVALSGCAKDDGLIVSGKSNSSAEKVSLTFFGFKADALNLTAIEDALQGFMAENPNIDISYEGIKGNDYWDAFDKRDETGTLDDVFMMHHDHVISMGEKGKLADLSDLPGLENFTREAREQFTNPDGSVYFLPTNNSTYNLYINTDLLKEHGQSVPTNWQEFKQVCDHFVSQGIVPIIANNRNSLTTIILSKGLFDTYQQDEAAIVSELAQFETDPALYAEKLAPGIEMASEMISSGWIDAEEALATGQTSDDLDLFVKGDRPFMLTGGWASSRVMAKNPSFEYGVYPYPILEDGSVMSVQVDTCISVNADSPNLEEAKAFVSYLIQPDVMWNYCDSLASFSPLAETRIPTEKTLAPSVKFLTNGKTVNRVDYRLSLPTEAAVTAASNSLLNGESVAQAQEKLLKELQG